HERKKTIPLVKVLWKNHPEREATWKNEEIMRTDYPYFFSRLGHERKKTIPLVKVLWKNHPEREATWKNEEIMRTDYPYFFSRLGSDHVSLESGVSVRDRFRFRPLILFGGGVWMHPSGGWMKRHNIADFLSGSLIFEEGFQGAGGFFSDIVRGPMGLESCAMWDRGSITWGGRDEGVGTVSMGASVQECRVREKGKNGGKGS
nr:hypothetical protein [Tanacetum cinerariifolium]